MTQITKDEALRMALEALENPFGIDEYNRSISDVAIIAVREVLGPELLIGNTLFPSPNQLAEQASAVQKVSCGHESCDCRSYCKKQQPAQQEPVAWMHILDNTDGIKANGVGMVSITQKRKHPFGKPGVDFDKSYSVKSIPLVAQP